MPEIPPIIPWAPNNIPTPLQQELNRRKINISFNYVNDSKGGWNEESGEWIKYKGPMSPWVRFCSNGVGKELDNHGNKILDSTKIKEGFVFFGGKNFYNGYGFSKNGQDNNESIIGYLPNGKDVHIIENNLNTSNYPIHVPSPEIEKVSINIQKELYRKVSIEWVCFSKAQLEYMTPYFLVPGISCIIEWGWNHFNSECLLDIDNINELKKLKNNPYPLYTDHILKSNGNYDVLFGIITNFEWSAEGNKFKCKTEITSPDRIYAGIALNANVVNRPEDDSGIENNIIPLNGIKEFFNTSLTEFKKLGTTSDPLSIPLLTDIVKYIQSTYKNDPNKNKWREYIYGIYYGREDSINTPKIQPISLISPVLTKDGIQPTAARTLSEALFSIDNPNRPIFPNQSSPRQPTIGAAINSPYNFKTDKNLKEDFDQIGKKVETWLNFGLIIEIINYHVKGLKSSNDEMFRIDIDDVIINGHPNLISSDGGILLIPNAKAPKYFSGEFGYSMSDEALKLGVGKEREFEALKEDYKSIMDNCTVNPPSSNIINKKIAKEQNKLPDYQLQKICGQSNGSLRDDLDEIINQIRYSPVANLDNKFEFPFDKLPVIDGKSIKYPIGYCGYLKNLYVSISHIKNLIDSGDIKTYVSLIEKILYDISEAAGGFWDFRLVSGTGDGNQKSGEAATLKIVDYNFMSVQTNEIPYSFDYFDSNSLILGYQFKPTLSNAQAIRTIYAQTNRPESHTTLTNGTNELLDYKFRDRLFKDDDIKTPPVTNFDDDGFKTKMKDLQRMNSPSPDAYQVTTRVNGKIIIRRLAIPSGTDLLHLLIDDGDEENNPQYTGIMPGIQASFTIQGIGGLRTFMMFLVKNLPEPYSHENVIFRIIDVQEAIDAGKWTTTMTAGIIPLRNNIKRRLGIQ